MTLTQTKPATRNRFQIRLDELHQLSIALHQQSLTNPTDELVRQIEEVARERELVYQEWEASWQPIATDSIEPAAAIPATATPATATLAATKSAAIPAAVQPATKKLMLSLVSVKRITSDVPACNFDRNELEIAGELSLAIGGFVIPPVLRRDGNNYKVISGHFQYHAAVLARRLNPRAGETIPAIVLELETQSAVLAQLEMLKLRAVLGF
jgi:hypothetical protein